MDRKEVKADLFDRSYEELVDHLLKKYGPAEYDYFCTESCTSKNKKASRSSEGLQCHHIDENKYRKLSDPRVAKLKPFECQKASHLVYCNILEHLLLHLHIILEDNSGQRLGLVGFFYISAMINDYYDGYEYTRESDKKLFEAIKDNYKQYVAVLYFGRGLVLETRPELEKYFTPERLAEGFRAKPVKKIYEMLAEDSPRS